MNSSVAFQVLRVHVSTVFDGQLCNPFVPILTRNVKERVSKGIGVVRIEASLQSRLHFLVPPMPRSTVHLTWIQRNFFLTWILFWKTCWHWWRGRWLWRCLYKRIKRSRHDRLLFAAKGLALVQGLTEGQTLVVAQLSNSS